MRDFTRLSAPLKGPSGTIPFASTAVRVVTTWLTTVVLGWTRAPIPVSRSQPQTDRTSLSSGPTCKNAAHSAGTMSAIDVSKRRCSSSIVVMELIKVLNLSNVFRFLATCGAPEIDAGRLSRRKYMESSGERRTMSKLKIVVLSGSIRSRLSLVSSSSKTTTKTESPTAILSPLPSFLSLMGTSLTNVPFRLSRSRMRISSSLLTIRQWRLDTERLSTQITLDGSRPMEISVPVKYNAFPFNGPDKATS